MRCLISNKSSHLMYIVLELNTFLEDLLRAHACEKVERISQFVDFIALRKEVCPLRVYGDIITCTASWMSDKRRNSNTI